MPNPFKLTLLDRFKFILLHAEVESRNASSFEDISDILYKAVWELPVPSELDASLRNGFGGGTDGDDGNMEVVAFLGKVVVFDQGDKVSGGSFIRVRQLVK